MPKTDPGKQIQYIGSILRHMWQFHLDSTDPFSATLDHVSFETIFEAVSNMKRRTSLALIRRPVGSTKNGDVVPQYHMTKKLIIVKDS